MVFFSIIYVCKSSNDMESRGAMIYMVEPVFEDFHDNSYIG
jgi:hypothetical protein